MRSRADVQITFLETARRLVRSFTAAAARITNRVVEFQNSSVIHVTALQRIAVNKA
jgi:hypothetical protein